MSLNRTALLLRPFCAPNPPTLLQFPASKLSRLTSQRPRKANFAAQVPITQGIGAPTMALSFTQMKRITHIHVITANTGSGQEFKYSRAFVRQRFEASSCRSALGSSLRKASWSFAQIKGITNIDAVAGSSQEFKPVLKTHHDPLCQSFEVKTPLVR